MSLSDSLIRYPALLVGVCFVVAALMLGACDVGAPVRSGESGSSDDAGLVSEPAGDDNSQDPTACAPLVSAPDGMVNLFPLDTSMTREYDYEFVYSAEYEFPLYNHRQTGTVLIQIVDIGPCSNGQRTVETRHEVTYIDVVRRDSSNGRSSTDSSYAHETFTHFWRDVDGTLSLVGGWPDYPQLQQYSDAPDHEIQRIHPERAPTVFIHKANVSGTWEWTYAAGVGLEKFRHDRWSNHNSHISEVWTLISNH